MIKIALIGIGHWGKNLARNFHALGSLHAICDIDRDLLSQFQSTYTSLTPDYNKILADPAIDAIVIATPAVTHYELAKQALEAGKDVYVEKPLALHLFEGEELIALAEKLDKILMVGHILQYHPALQKLKELLPDLGPLRYISSHRLNLGRICTVENALFSYATHDISMILSLVPTLPEKVQCFGGTFLKEGVADTTLTTLSFPDNIQAHIYASWLNPFKEQKLTLVGRDAMVVFDDTKPWEEKLLLTRDYLKSPQQSYIEVSQKEPLREECKHFLHCCTTRTTPHTSGQRALNVLRVLEAAQDSLQVNSLLAH